MTIVGSKTEPIWRQPLVRRCVSGSISDILMGFVFGIFWPLMLIVEPNSFLRITVVPVLGQSLWMVYAGFKRIYRIVAGGRKNMTEVPLVKERGTFSGRLVIERPAVGVYGLFFGTNQNELEGNVVWREFSEVSKSESTVLLNPGWRRLLRTPKYEPIYFRLAEADCSRVVIEIRLALLNLHLHPKRLDGIERIAVLTPQGMQVRWANGSMEAVLPVEED